MKIIVSGSIATDHLMTYPGRFADALVGDQLENVSLSFLVDDLAIRRGGAGANIAFNLGCLGLSPMLVGAVGADFGEYGEWLSRHGVDVSGVQLSESKHTARFLCTTDADQNQIASFYTGAMAEARDIELTPHVRRSGGVDVVLVAPNDPVAMLRHTARVPGPGLPVRRRPQPAARADGRRRHQAAGRGRHLPVHQPLRARPAGAEDRLVRAPTCTTRVEVSVMTRGANGVTVQRTGQPDVFVKPPQEVRKSDPTGVGDAFRAGFLAGMAWGSATSERPSSAACSLPW